MGEEDEAPREGGRGEGGKGGRGEWERMESSGQGRRRREWRTVLRRGSARPVGHPPPSWPSLDSNPAVTSVICRCAKIKFR